MNNTLSLDLADKEVADAFGGKRVGDVCQLDDVQLRIKRINQSHDNEYDPKTGKETGKKVMRGSIDLEVQGFSYDGNEYELSDAKGGSGKTADAPAQAAMPAGAGGKSKGGLVVAIGLGKSKPSSKY